jgi:hypothetical protein
LQDFSLEAFSSVWAKLKKSHAESFPVLSGVTIPVRGKLFKLKKTAGLFV